MDKWVKNSSQNYGLTEPINPELLLSLILDSIPISIFPLLNVLTSTLWVSTVTVFILFTVHCAINTQ